MGMFGWQSINYNLIEGWKNVAFRHLNANNYYVPRN